MSVPVDHDVATRLRLAEERWLDQCAARLSRARVRPQQVRRPLPSPPATRRAPGVTS